jgi:hypothetical protein
MLPEYTFNKIGEQDCTSILQPLDQGIIRTFKSHYRTKMLQRIIATSDRIELTEDTSLLDALHYVKAAWSNVTSQTIQNCFVLAGFSSILNFPIEQEDSLDQHVVSTYCKIRNCDNFDFNNYVNVDNNQKTCDTCDLEIVENRQSIEDDSKELELIVPIITVIELSQGFQYIYELKRLSSSLDCDLSDLIKVEDLLINNQFNRIKQSSILEFIK